MNLLLNISTELAVGTLFLVFIVALLVTYFLVKDAVNSGTKEVKQQLMLQNNLTIRQMMKDGFTEEEIKDAMNKAIKRK
ncbi:MAG TPA: hypothetical protein VM888_02635 [Chitinophagaceae bacterium]|nr:hypothetical protein [Chitinophagaceae bacterium]